MNFKKYLGESATNDHAAKFFDVKELKLNGLLHAYRNAGYEVSRQDEKTFIECFYKGYKKGSGHMFLTVCQDDDDKEEYYVADFLVTLGESGMIEAKPGGRPLKSEVSQEDAEKFVKDYKMK